MGFLERGTKAPKAPRTSEAAWKGKASQHGGFNSSLGITGRSQQKMHDIALMHTSKVIGYLGERSSLHGMLLSGLPFTRT